MSPSQKATPQPLAKGPLRSLVVVELDAHSVAVGAPQKLTLTSPNPADIKLTAFFDEFRSTGLVYASIKNLSDRPVLLFQNRMSNLAADTVSLAETNCSNCTPKTIFIEPGSEYVLDLTSTAGPSLRSEGKTTPTFRLSLRLNCSDAAVTSNTVEARAAHSTDGRNISINGHTYVAEMAIRDSLGGMTTTFVRGDKPAKKGDEPGLLVSAGDFVDMKDMLRFHEEAFRQCAFRVRKSNDGRQSDVEATPETRCKQFVSLWALDKELERALGERLRKLHPFLAKLKAVGKTATFTFYEGAQTDLLSAFMLFEVGRRRQFPRYIQTVLQPDWSRAQTNLGFRMQPDRGRFWYRSASGVKIGNSAVITATSQQDLAEVLPLF